MDWGFVVDPVDQWTACFKVVVDVPPVVSLEEMAENQKKNATCAATCAVVNTLSKSSSIDHPLLHGKNLSFG